MDAYGRKSKIRALAAAEQGCGHKCCADQSEGGGLGGIQGEIERERLGEGAIAAEGLKEYGIANSDQCLGGKSGSRMLGQRREITLDDPYCEVSYIGSRTA